MEETLSRGDEDTIITVLCEANDGIYLVQSRGLSSCRGTVTCNDTCSGRGDGRPDTDVTGNRKTKHHPFTCTCESSSAH